MLMSLLIRQNLPYFRLPCCSLAFEAIREKFILSLPHSKFILSYGNLSKIDQCCVTTNDEVDFFQCHSASKGCSRCKKTFPGGFGKKDYSGFDREHWQPRSNEGHVEEMRRIQQCRTKGEREALSREYGTRYSVLSDLTYYSSVRMAIIDPMHNLFLGTAKHILNIWKSENLLDEQKLSKIEDNFENIEAASDVGKLPTKVLSAYNKFTADELKNWVLLFSLFALKDVLEENYLQGWRDFVLACRLLCSRVITEEDITLADLLLLRFCRSFERLYGHERVTPNMHLHGHLKECLMDYGPVYSFWLFSFERYNGILGSLPTNKRIIEKQLMRRFL